MRIIGGEARGRKLLSPSGEHTRPTADKVRESLFNILARRVPDARVLDLFGGTGAFALEALSRGARHAYICDISAQAERVIRQNAARVLGEDYAARAIILRRDYRSAIADINAPPFDIVFIDPPYDAMSAYSDAAQRLARKTLIASESVIVMERLAQAQIALTNEFEVSDTRVYGRTAVDFVNWRGAN